jgi:dolichyl-diphosphooligosaccharide--protein glycosyltransferase
MVRLYYYHGSAREAAPVVVDWQEGSAQTRAGETVQINYAPQNQSLVRANFDNMSAARAYVEQDGSAQIGGIGPYPQERVSALEHYRLVKVSNSSALGSAAYRNSLLQKARMTGVSPQFLRPSSPSWVKTFERVPGATIEGSGAPPNSNVTASVQMKIPTSNQTFVYRQRAQTDDDGEFTMVLPYSTTDYDQYGPENGYTNVSVRATGDYRITGPQTINESGYIVAYGTNLSVSEGLVSGATEGPKEVTLERRATETSLVRNDAQNNSTGSENSSDLVPVEGSLSASDPADTGSDGGDGSTAGVASSDAPATLAPAERFGAAVSVP